MVNWVEDTGSALRVYNPLGTFKSFDWSAANPAAFMDYSWSEIFNSVAPEWAPYTGKYSMGEVYLAQTIYLMLVATQGDAAAKTKAFGSALYTMPPSNVANAKLSQAVDIAKNRGIAEKIIPIANAWAAAPVYSFSAPVKAALLDGYQSLLRATLITAAVVIGASAAAGGLSTATFSPAVTAGAAPAGVVTTGGGAEAVAAAAAPATGGALASVGAAAGGIASTAATTLVAAKIQKEVAAPKPPAPPSFSDAGIAQAGAARPAGRTSDTTTIFAAAALVGAAFLI